MMALFRLAMSAVLSPLEAVALPSIGMVYRVATSTDMLPAPVKVLSSDPTRFPTRGIPTPPPAHIPLISQGCARILQGQSHGRPSYILGHQYPSR